MTTYRYPPTTDFGKVCIHINDSDREHAKLKDEEIQYALDEAGSVGGAVVLCFQFLMAKVTDPNFTADWLQVDHASAYKSLQSLMNEKRRLFGIPITGQTVQASAVHTYRVDSRQTEDSDYSVDGDDSVTTITITIPE